jgi:GH15 family glucan-1,4-alpha-glucosidase
MSQRIEDYGLVGDTHTAALIGRDGSADWLCFPRFDSAACFAALLGDERHGRWLLAPSGGVRRVWRSYSPGTLVLETEFESEDGTVRIVDCMPPRQKHQISSGSWRVSPGRVCRCGCSSSRASNTARSSPG